MAEHFSGKVLFANGYPAQNVLVRVFDDEPGKGNDDLTVNPGRSDDQGRFTVCFESYRHLDYGKIQTSAPLPSGGWKRQLNLQDIHIQYLEFRYTFNGRRCVHIAVVMPLQKEFHLPEIPTFEFKPSVHGFKFSNNFYGYLLPFSIQNLPNTLTVEKTYGFCGGMAAAAYDFRLAARTIPSTISTPKQLSVLHQYLYQRQIDTFGVMGEYIAKFAQWMLLPEQTIIGTQKRTYDEFVEIRAKLNEGNAVVLGLVQANNSHLKIWNNHQVLAYGYSKTSANIININIYDPNYPQRDDLIIKIEQVPLSTTFIPDITLCKETILGFKCTRNLPYPNDKLRGFFAMPYMPVSPPKKIGEE
jgi:hypothetical protein